MDKKNLRQPSAICNDGCLKNSFKELLLILQLLQQEQLPQREQQRLQLLLRQRLPQLSS